MSDPQRLPETHDFADDKSQPTSQFPVLPSPPDGPLMHRLFIGDGQLRPIWRVLLFLLIWRGLFIVLAAVFFHIHRLHGIWLNLFAEACLLVSVAVATVIMAAIEHRPPGDYGLPLRHAFGKLFWWGAIWGMASLSLLLLMMHGAGVFDVGGLALHGVRIFKFAMFWAFLFLLVALYEELLARGYVLFTLTQSVGFWPSAVLFSVGFGLLHL